MIGDATDVARLRTLLCMAEAALGEAAVAVQHALRALDGTSQLTADDQGEPDDQEREQPVYDDLSAQHLGALLPQAVQAARAERQPGRQGLHLPSAPGRRLGAEQARGTVEAG